MTDTTYADLQPLVDDLVASVKETALQHGADLWDDVKDFVADKAALYAREKHKALTADSDDKRLEHERNLQHLVAQIEGEVVTLQIEASLHARLILSSALSSLGNFLVTTSPSVASRLLGLL